MEKEIIIIKAGGSMFSKSETNLFDFELALKYKSVFDELTDKYKFIWVLGGGAVCRMYQNNLKNFDVRDVDLDWVGVYCNNLNAILMRVALGKNAEENVLINEQITNTSKIKLTKDYLVVGGEKPGQTGDGATVTIALKAGAKKIFSFKNVDGVYSEDPKKNKDAKFFDRLSWNEYFNIIGTTEHTPGDHYPVDPVASKKSFENGLEFVILDGSDLSNIKDALQGKSFKGTTIY